MPKGSNCALVYEYKPNLQVGCIYNRMTVINVQMTCQQYIIQEIYENGKKVCIEAFAQNFIDAKGSNCALVYEYKPNL